MFPVPLFVRGGDIILPVLSNPASRWFVRFFSFQTQLYVSTLRLTCHCKRGKNDLRMDLNNEMSDM